MVCLESGACFRKGALARVFSHKDKRQLQVFVFKTFPITEDIKFTKLKLLIINNKIYSIKWAAQKKRQKKKGGACLN